MTNFHIAIGSTTSLPGGVENNLAQIIDFARRAGEDGADLLLTPEMSASGYGGFSEVLAVAEVAGNGPIYDALARTAGETNVVLCAGFAEKSDKAGSDDVHLSHYIIFPDGKFLVQRKHEVTPAERPLARPELPEGEHDFVTFDVAGVTCAITICADSGIENIREKLRAKGVRMILQPTGAGGLREDRVTDAELRTPEGRQTYARVLQTVFFPGEQSAIDSIRLGQALAAVNMCGYDQQRFFHVGHGIIMTPLGEVPAFFHGIPNLDRQRPMYAHAVIDMDDVISDCV